MKQYIAILFLIFCYQASAFGQEKASTKAKSENSFEFFAVPLFLYNQISVGGSWKTPSRFEHAFYVSSSLLLIGTTPLNLNLSYNLNRYCKNSKWYVPFWARISNTHRNVGYEEGYFPHTLRYAIGSGIGSRVRLGNRIDFRTEFGLGVSLNTTNSRNGFGYFSYDFDNQYPKQNPIILPAARFKVMFVLKPRAEK